MKIPAFKILKNSKQATVLAAVVVVVVALGGTSAYAAHSDALPGSAMYPFKKLWEGSQMLLSFGPASKAQTNVSIAQNRVKAAQAAVSQTPAATNSSNALTALQEAQQHLQTALTQTSQINDPTQKKEVAKSISDAAAEAEKQVEAEKESEASTTDKQNLQQTSDQIKQIQDQASTDD